MGVYVCTDTTDGGHDSKNTVPDMINMIALTNIVVCAAIVEASSAQKVIVNATRPRQGR